MKHSVITGIYNLEKDLKALSNFIYNNPEPAFKENKCYAYILELLKKHNFKIQENFLSINTSFYASFGNGHPKICYICKYSSCEDGHIYGNNINSIMNIGAALALSKGLNNNISGTVILIGCPGEPGYGSELMLTKEGILDDIDIVISAHPYIKNYESGSSISALPIEITFSPNDNVEYNNPYCTYDACLLTLNTLKVAVDNYYNKYYIDDLSIGTSKNINNKVPNACIKLLIKSENQNHCSDLKNHIKEHLNSICNMMKIQYSIHMFQLPSDNLKTNKLLSELFTNNEKQCGIIDVKEGIIRDDMLSIGSISHKTPAIYPAICITNNPNIKYPSIEFRDISNESFAVNEGIKAAKALALTGLDIIQSKSLLEKITLL